MRPLMRAALAALFVFAQSALTLHHHEVPGGTLLSPKTAARAAAAAVSPADDCALCAAQIQPRTSAPEPVSVAVPAVLVVVLPAPAPETPRVARPARVSDRSPPAAA